MSTADIRSTSDVERHHDHGKQQQQQQQQHRHEEEEEKEKQQQQQKQSLLTETCHVREARPSDYSAVVEGIGNALGPRDWLPAKFHEFLEDDDVTAFVVEVPGQGPVGFYLAQYLDGGRTIIKRAGRMHPNYRGLGLFRHLGECLIQHAKKKCPTAEREVMVAAQAAFPRVKKLDYQLIYIVDVYYVTTLLSDLTPIHPSGYANVHKMTESDIKLFFDSAEAWEKIVPLGYLWMENTPMGRYRENIKRLTNHRTEVFMSLEEEKNEGLLTDTNVTNLSMISIGHYFDVKDGLAYNMEFFSDNFDHLAWHMKRHTSNAARFGKDKVRLLVSIVPHRKEFVDGKVKEIFRGMGVCWEKQAVWNTDSVFQKMCQ